MKLPHVLDRLRVKTKRKALVSRYLARTQREGSTSRMALLAYVWLPPLRPLLSGRVRIERAGRVAEFAPKTYFDLEVLRDIFEDEDCAIPFDEPPRVIFDLGAHVGLSALYYALTYPEADIYCFEAEPGNLRQLRKNVARFDRIYAFNYAICGYDRPVRLHVHPRSVSHSLVERHASGASVEVQGRDLDSLMDGLGIEHVDLVKFNIEGMEFEVLENFRRRDQVGAYLGYFHFDLSPDHDERFIEEVFDGYDVIVLPSKPNRAKVIAVRRAGPI